MAKGTDSAAVSPPEVGVRLEAERVRLIYGQADLGIAVTLINGALLVYVLWQLISPWRLLVWLGLNLALSLARYIIILSYRRAPSELARAPRWGRLFRAGMVLNGLLWGSTGVFLFPDTSLAHQAFLLLILGGMVAGAVGTYATDFRAFVFYAVPVLLPLVLHMIVHNDPMYLAFGGVTLLFLAVMIGSARRIGSQTLAALSLRFENADLVGTLFREKERTEQLNRELQGEVGERRRAEAALREAGEQLEQRVRERTAELKQSNRSLQQQIEERERAEAALKQSEESYRLLYNCLSEGLALQEMIYDEGGQAIDFRILEVNPAYAQIMGIDSEAAVGRLGSELLSEMVRDHLALLAQVAKSGEPAQIDSLERHDDQVLRVSVFSPRRGQFAVLFEDVTQRRRLKQELVRVQKLESLGVLAGGLAHDFNNIMTAVVGNISLAKLHLVEQPEVTQLLDEAELACDRAKGLTRQLLTFSRGGAPIKKLSSLTNLIQESCSFALRGTASRCLFEIAPNLWPVEVDLDQFSQVLHNLAINAHQAMPQGGLVEVSAKNVELTDHSQSPLEPGTYIRLAISDQGRGISREHLVKIFDPYFTTKEQGSGLGLSTVYSIVKKHGGHVTVDSSAVAGTTFTIYLPAAPLAVVPEASPQPSQKWRGSGRVLVMDDDAMVRQVLGLMLEELGYEVAHAPGGEQAIRAYQTALGEERPFALVIMDLTIPGGMGGQEAAGQILKLDPQARLLVSSGYSNDPIMSSYQDYGFVGIVVKPYTLTKLSEILQQLVDRRGPPPGGDQD